MTAEDPHSIDLSAFIAERLERAEPDLLRSMLSSFVQALMLAEAEAICGVLTEDSRPSSWPGPRHSARRAVRVPWSV